MTNWAGIGAITAALQACLGSPELCSVVVLLNLVQSHGSECMLQGDNVSQS